MHTHARGRRIALLGVSGLCIERAARRSEDRSRAARADDSNMDDDMKSAFDRLANVDDPDNL